MGRIGEVLVKLHTNPHIKGIQQKPWKQPRNPYSPFEIASADQIEEIHQASLRILRELGIAFLDDEALDILKEQYFVFGLKIDNLSSINSPPNLDKLYKSFGVGKLFSSNKFAFKSP